MPLSNLAQSAQFEDILITEILIHIQQIQEGLADYQQTLADQQKILVGIATTDLKRARRRPMVIELGVGLVLVAVIANAWHRFIL